MRVGLDVSPLDQTAAGTARYLAARGFGEEALEAALGKDFAPDP